MWKPLTGEPYAGKPHVRFGGRGGAEPSLPLSSDACAPRGARLLTLVDVGGGDGLDAVGGGEAHGGFEFFVEDFEHLADALLAAGAEGVDHCSTK